MCKFLFLLPYSVKKITNIYFLIAFKHYIFIHKRNCQVNVAYGHVSKNKCMHRLKRITYKKSSIKKKTISKRKPIHILNKNVSTFSIKLIVNFITFLISYHRQKVQAILKNNSTLYVVLKSKQNYMICL